MIKLSEQDNQLTRSYANRWFWSRNQIAEATMVGNSTLDQMFLNECAPGIIYSYTDEHGWWSALSDGVGQEQSDIPPGGDDWYTPAALWWLRRALLIIRQGHSIDEAGKSNRQAFGEEFSTQLRKTPEAQVAYPDCFDSQGLVDVNQVQTAASGEWNVWVQGGYGVCLRDFSAAKCIRKETISAILKSHFDNEQDFSLKEIQILPLCQELTALITPFAPWERPSGTPGKTIDAALSYFEMGNDHPYPFYS